MAKFYVNIPLDLAFLAFISVVILYIIFWFSLGWLVISFQKTSSQNAIILLFSWVMLTVVMPAISTAIINYRLPVSETFQTVVDSRDGYHTQWDKPKLATLQKFYEHYPQFSNFKLPEGDFNYLWYYAMQQMGDDESASASNQLQQKLRQREAFSGTLGTLFPSIHTSLTMNDLSKSGLKNQLNFQEELVKFHEKKRLYFYPKIFSESPVLSENWKAFPLEYYTEKLEIDWAKILLPLLIISILCFGFGENKLKNLIY
jgi:ABC-2 type transport system permease protein